MFKLLVFRSYRLQNIHTSEALANVLCLTHSCFQPASHIITKCSESNAFLPKNLILGRTFPLHALVGVTGHPKSTVSKHMAILRLPGWPHPLTFLQLIVADLLWLFTLGEGWVAFSIHTEEYPPRKDYERIASKSLYSTTCYVGGRAPYRECQRMHTFLPCSSV